LLHLDSAYLKAGARPRAELQKSNSDRFVRARRASLNSSAVIPAWWCLSHGLFQTSASSTPGLRAARDLHSGLCGVPKPATAYDIAFREAIRFSPAPYAFAHLTTALAACLKLWQTQLFKGCSAKGTEERKFRSPVQMT